MQETTGRSGNSWKPRVSDPSDRVVARKRKADFSRDYDLPDNGQIQDSVETQTIRLAPLEVEGSPESIQLFDTNLQNLRDNHREQFGLTIGELNKRVKLDIKRARARPPRPIRRLVGLIERAASDMSQVIFLSVSFVFLLRVLRSILLCLYTSLMSYSYGLRTSSHFSAVQAIDGHNFAHSQEGFK